MFERTHRSWQFVTLFLILATNNLGGHPQDSETKEHTKIWRQMGDCLENGHKNQRSNTHKEDESAQMRRNLKPTCSLFRTLDIAFQCGTNN